MDEDAYERVTDERCDVGSEHPEPAEPSCPHCAADTQGGG